MATRRTNHGYHYLRRAVGYDFAHKASRPLVRKSSSIAGNIAQAIWKKSIFGQMQRASGLRAALDLRKAKQAQRTAFHASTARVKAIKDHQKAVAKANTPAALARTAKATAKANRAKSRAVVSRIQNRTRGGERPEYIRLMKQKHTKAGQMQRKLQADIVRGKRKRGEL
jgi:hypothetical protein